MDELLGRKMPYSSEAEQSILGSMLIDPACIPDVIGAVRGAEFYIDANRDIFETMYAMFAMGAKIDPVTVLDEMRTRGCWKENSQQYLMELMDVTPTAANVIEYCTIVRDRALLRELGASATAISDKVYQENNSAQEVLELAEQKIYALRKESTERGLQPMARVLQDVLSQISQAAAGGGQLAGVSTGFADIDECLQGLGAGNFIVIASRPGMGKTSIALNMASSVAKNTGKTVAIFSLEMSRLELAMRLLSNESRIPLSDLNQGKLNADAWNRLWDAANVLYKMDIRMDDNSNMTVAEMAAQCRRIENLGLVVVDYLQLMQKAGNENPRSSDNRQQIVSNISRMMKVTAKELGVPVICMSQVNRDNEGRSDKRPTLSDLRESGSIEQDADVVIGLYREGYYNEECEDLYAAEAIILKNRRGRLGKVPLRWLPEYTTYVSDERRHTDDEY